MAAREPRGKRRRPGLKPPRVEKIPPRSGRSREEVVANQRRRIFEGYAAALAYHGYEDTKITDIVELAGLSRATFYEHFEGKEICFAARPPGQARTSARSPASPRPCGRLLTLGSRVGPSPFPRRPCACSPAVASHLSGRVLAGRQSGSPRTTISSSSTCSLPRWSPRGGPPIVAAIAFRALPRVAILFEVKADPDSGDFRRGA